MLNVILGVVLPFLGTVLGASLVFFLKDKMNEIVEKILLGFAAGVMVAVCIWSLILPAMEMSTGLGGFAFLPSVIGFLIGMFFLLILDSLIPHLHVNSEEPEGVKSQFKRSTMMFFAVTLHNIPEGMAVGVVLAGVYYGNTLITLSGALALALGIAIQNLPEGAIVSMPLKNETTSKKKAFTYGVLSGIVEPIASLLTIVSIRFVEPALPYFLAFAAGAMMYVVVEELIPESQSNKHTNVATISFAFGFVLMMILDVAFA